MTRSILNHILSKFNLHLNWIYPRSFERFAVSGNGLVGVEIGVFEGNHALGLLKELDIKKLYLIDPYLQYVEEGSSAYQQNNLLNVKKIATRRFANDERVTFLIGKSEDMKDEVPNDLDFVYIDGNHDYENVKKDIENYYPKLKEGGILGGHDMDNRFDGLINAVIEFVVRENLQLYVKDMDWWVKK